MYRILHTLPALDSGGAERIIFDYTTRMINDFQFDFIVHTKKEGMLEKELKQLGCKIFHVPPYHENKNEYFRQISLILRNQKYDVIHVSQGYKGFYFLKYAKKYGIKVRIAHSHMAYIPCNTKDKIIRKIATLFAKLYSTDLFACGEDAGKWMWGKGALNSGKVFLMKNAINTKKFLFNEARRRRIRNNLRIDGSTFVIGNIARFSYQKNHEFLIRVFKKVVDIIPNSKLVLVGCGELEKEIKELVAEYGILDKVLFIGSVDDTSGFYDCFDCFALPSRFEGLPVVLVEALANGLPVVVSSSVTNDFAKYRQFLYLPLVEETWANQISKIKKISLDSPLSRTVEQKELKDFDLDSCVSDLKNKYLALIQK